MITYTIYFIILFALALLGCLLTDRDIGLFDAALFVILLGAAAVKIIL